MDRGHKFVCLLQLNSFEQLCINYTNEKLHKFFNHYVFSLEQKVYAEEEINFSHISFTDNTVCLELIEKPPKCILKMLDDECRFPKGTDTSYIEKQNAALKKHPHYVMPADKRIWLVEFGVNHYAGPVMYTVNKFLDKNKDVQQDQLFEFMRKSKDPFVTDVCNYQDILSRSLALARQQSKALNEPSTKSSTKGKPTVGDTFRQQLVALVDILANTNPWYVRCLKPNHNKAADDYDDDLIITQLRYSGMLDIIRIRREGFPVHVPASTFLDKYRCLASKDPRPLPKDEKKAAAQILRSLNLPETEWQIGKTKVFLRNTVFDPLEDRRKKLLHETIILIQKYWRRCIYRKRYLAMKAAAIKIQAFVRCQIHRIRFVRKRRAAIIIQSHLRGMFAREFVAELRRKKQREEEERRRRLKEEAERRKREEAEERERLETMSRNKAVEDSFQAAQRELYSLARMAEIKSQKTKKATGEVDLDAMFEFLSDRPQLHGEDEMAFVSQIQSELDAMFRESQPKAEGSRTMRRRRRVQKKLLGLHEEDDKKEETFNIQEYSMVAYAEKWFNDHPKDSGGLGTLTLRKRTKSGLKGDTMPKEDMVRYTKSTNLATSLIHMHDPENVNLACSIFKDLCKFLRGDLKPEQINLTIQSIIAYGLDRTELRDEIYCQIIRQLTENPKVEQVARGWHLLCLCVVAFPPGKSLNKYLQAFIRRNTEDPNVGRCAIWSLNTLRLTKATQRRMPPSSMEIACVRNLNNLICRFYFLDGKAKAIGVDPSATGGDVVRVLADKIELQNVDGWALYEVNPERERYIRGVEYIADLLAIWERDRRSSIQMTKYTTVSKKGHTSAMGAGDSKFVFRKRLFRNPKDIPQDPVEYHLIYAQAVHSVVRVDEFPVDERVALQLAGFQCQVTWGDYDVQSSSRYGDIFTYLPERIIRGRDWSQDDWSKAIAEAHKEYGQGKTNIQAKVWYLTSVKNFQLYGATLFYVIYKGFWSYPNNLILALDNSGFKFVHVRTKAIMAEFPYSRLESVSIDVVEQAVTLNMKTKSPEEQKYYTFQTHQKEDIAALIASYSPQHSNVRRVGDLKLRRGRVTDEERIKAWEDVRFYRKVLAEHNLLRRPADSSGGFLTTTLRRYNKAKLERLQKQKEGKDFEKVFKQNYWSYSKSRLPQPLSMFVGDELDDFACRMFASLQIYAGITNSGGFDGEDDPMHVSMIQMVISKCLEKEVLCNEFYLQLIKQTTDQPDPNSRINIQNWRFMAMTCGVVVPRSKDLVGYLMAHLHRCSLDTGTEEGQWAQYCLQAVQRTQANRNRKYPPSRQEVMCVMNRRLIHARFHFMDGQFRALEFDSAATTEEVVEMVKDRIGLRSDASGFSLFEVFGQLERNMLPQEKVADAIFKWEKYAKSTNSHKSLKLTFKKRLFLKPYTNPTDRVEFNLVFHQAIDDVVNDRFPVSYEEAVYLAALRAHVELGEYQEYQIFDYTSIVTRCLPKHMQQNVEASKIAQKHRELIGRSKDECNQAYMEFVSQWSLYGATLFEVLQSYTFTLPKNLWLAVDQNGIHILKRREKEPLVSYTYRSIVNYSPSLKNLMIVTESLTRGTKFVFNTSQASQIAHLIRDYTHIIVEKQRRSSQPNVGSQAAAPSN
jgi:myosin-7